MKTKFFIPFFVLLAVCGTAIGQVHSPIWPDDKMPNSKGKRLEKIEDKERITQVDRPELYAFFPSADENKRSAVIIFNDYP